MTTMRLQDFKVLSFDCYGTLIDWETGIWQSLQPLLRTSRLSPGRDQALADFAAIEPQLEHDTPDLLYRDILALVHASLAVRWKAPPDRALDLAFGASIGNWPVFPDTCDALSYLKRHFRLVILSNVDRHSFAATNLRLGVTFDAICTAQDIGTYKPNPGNFDYLLRTVESLGCKQHELLHVAQSLYHDIEPAERFGIARCWINRRKDVGLGSGATRTVEQVPEIDFEFTSLGALADQHRKNQL